MSILGASPLPFIWSLEARDILQDTRVVPESSGILGVINANSQSPYKF
jgi:hypothetical protein